MNVEIIEKLIGCNLDHDSFQTYLKRYDEALELPPPRRALFHVSAAAHLDAKACYDLEVEDRDALKHQITFHCAMLLDTYSVRLGSLSWRLEHKTPLRDLAAALAREFSLSRDFVSRCEVISATVYRIPRRKFELAEVLAYYILKNS